MYSGPQFLFGAGRKTFFFACVKSADLICGVIFCSYSDLILGFRGKSRVAKTKTHTVRWFKLRCHGH